MGFDPELIASQAGQPCQHWPEPFEVVAMLGMEEMEIQMHHHISPAGVTFRLGLQPVSFV